MMGMLEIKEAGVGKKYRRDLMGSRGIVQVCSNSLFEFENLEYRDIAGEQRCGVGCSSGKRSSCVWNFRNSSRLRD